MARYPWSPRRRKDAENFSKQRAKKKQYLAAELMLLRLTRRGDAETIEPVRSTVQLIQKRARQLNTPRPGPQKRSHSALESIQPKQARNTKWTTSSSGRSSSVRGKRQQGRADGQDPGRGRATRRAALLPHGFEKGRRARGAALRLESAARRIGGFLLRRARERMGKEEERAAQARTNTRYQDDGQTIDKRDQAAGAAAHCRALCFRRLGRAPG